MQGALRQSDLVASVGRGLTPVNQAAVLPRYFRGFAFQSGHIGPIVPRVGPAGLSPAAVTR